MSLKVVVIGGNGFLGQKVSRAVTSLSRMNISPTEDCSLDKIIIFDVDAPSDSFRNSLSSDKRVEFVRGDLCDRSTMLNVLNPTNFDRVTVIHLAAILSGPSEKKFDLSMKVNVYGTLNMLECIRNVSDRLGSPQIYFYASSDYTLAYIPVNTNNVTTEESFRLSPVSYGCQKASMEILISDYTRKGFVDGRVGRFCGILGKYNLADSISYAWHGPFTQTLQGKDYECGMSLDSLLPCSDVNVVVQNTIYLSSRVDSKKIGHNRVINVPSRTFSIREIHKKAQEVGRKYNIRMGRLILIDPNKGASTVKILDVNPRISIEKAKALGCPYETHIGTIIENFVKEYIINSKRSKVYYENEHFHHGFFDVRKY